ncbi:efflux RND transporter periplasmic adaptor subunit [Candidatus Methylomicrobium oryzae]|jgi:macrolide-specific efflux system membrane fusion protein|uniref:efflux RND transporter periplasmic adaptor subunit n=1 Tax=Candidatus Methylomicrobium oryzae TaxID=2802053 RepID=UPI0019212B0E|nr:efflux RND transporter periplasmic adaptor subunit [Methylomicrobium sp. RS1]MBL1263787.1 efflux RND transporter periplasmic adaptor subunit [Methylomicrobium sp. RS1]
MQAKPFITRRHLYWLAGLLAVLMTAGAALRFYFQKETESAQAAMKESIVEIAYGDIEENVTAQGKLEPKEYVDIGAQVTGQLQKLFVEIGDVVKTGQQLAQIDPRIYAARVQADEASINNLKAQLVQQEALILFADRQYARNRKLYPTKAVSQETLQNSESNSKAALAVADSIRAQIQQVESTLAGDRTNLGYTKIFASMDGTVVQQTAREGQTLNANQQTPNIMQLAKLDKMTVRSQTAEADIMRIKVGMPVYFTTLGSDQRRWQGVVRQILPTPEVVNNVVLYNVLVDVDNEDGQLMSGMSAQVFFVLGEARHVPVIPVNALGKRLHDQDSGKGRAYQVKTVEADNRVSEKVIHVGLQNRRFAEIRDGLSVGDRVRLTLASPKNNRGRDSYRPPSMPRI